MFKKIVTAALVAHVTSLWAPDPISNTDTVNVVAPTFLEETSPKLAKKPYKPLFATRSLETDQLLQQGENKMTQKQQELQKVKKELSAVKVQNAKLESILYNILKKTISLSLEYAKSYGAEEFESFLKKKEVSSDGLIGEAVLNLQMTGNWGFKDFINTLNRVQSRLSGEIID